MRYGYFYPQPISRSGRCATGMFFYFDASSRYCYIYKCHMDHFTGATSTTLLGHLTNFPLYLYLAHSKTLWLVKYTNHLLQIFTANSQLHIYYKNLQTKTIWYRKSNTQNNKAGNGLHIETNGIRLGSTHWNSWFLSHLPLHLLVHHNDFQFSLYLPKLDIYYHIRIIQL
jgi:hypothetical protein